MKDLYHQQLEPQKLRWSRVAGADVACKYGTYGDCPETAVTSIGPCIEWFGLAHGSVYRFPQRSEQQLGPTTV